MKASIFCWLPVSSIIRLSGAISMIFARKMSATEMTPCLCSAVARTFTMISSPQFMVTLEVTVEELAKCFLKQYGEDREISYGRCHTMIQSNSFKCASTECLSSILKTSPFP